MHTFSLKGKGDGEERKYTFLYVTELEKQHTGCCLQVISDWGFFFEKAIERTDGSYYYVVMERQPQIGDLLFYLGFTHDEQFWASFLFEDRIIFTAPKYPKPFRLITNSSSITENDLEISKDIVAFLELNLSSKFSLEPKSWQHKP